MKPNEKAIQSLVEAGYVVVDDKPASCFMVMLEDGVGVTQAACVIDNEDGLVLYCDVTEADEEASNGINAKTLRIAEANELYEIAAILRDAINKHHG